MDFDTFYNEWIPEHCPIHPLTSCVCVHLYLDENNKIKNMAWVDKTGPEKHSRFRFIIHDKERVPIPDVKNVISISNHKPYIDVHYTKHTDIECRD